VKFNKIAVKVKDEGQIFPANSTRQDTLVHKIASKPDWQFSHYRQFSYTKVWKRSRSNV